MLPRLCVILALCSTVAAAAPVTLQVSSAFDWGQELLVRTDLRSGDVRFTLAGLSGALLTGPDTSILAGVSTPWLRMGPLSPAGILREACNPLGFQAGSDVFVQRSGFVLDGSFPPQPSGVLLMPLARTIGAFYRPLADGGEWLGCMTSVFHRPGVSVEGFLSMSNPVVETAGEEWTSDAAPRAGGRIFATAARMLVETRPFGMTATFGASLAEMSPPGSFVNLHVAARAGILRLYLLLGKADSSYTGPSGRHPLAASAASAALLLADSRGSADIRFSQAVSQPPFSPHPFLASRSEASFRIEKTVSAVSETLFHARVEGGTIIHRDVKGEQDPATRCSAAVEARISPLRSEAGAAWNQADGLSALLTAEAALDRRGSLAAFEGTVLHLDGDAQTFSTFLSLRLEGPDFRVTFRAGLEDARLCAPGEDFASGLRLSVEWRVTEVTEWGSPAP